MTVEVDNTPPIVSIQLPLPDSTIFGSTTLRIEFDDVHLKQYTLEYALQEDADDSDWVTIRDRWD